MTFSIVSCDPSHSIGGGLDPTGSDEADTIFVVLNVTELLTT